MALRPKKPLQRTAMSGKIKRLFLVFLLIPFWIFLRSVYRDRIAAFGCFDDCFNYMGGYFLLQGKHLFSEIFFNHMPMMAYISAAIQYVTKPDSLYMLVYEHRMFLIYFSLIADILLVLRFGLVGFAFSILYEATKGYVFGERFLAEAVIIYPIVYLFGVSWELLGKKKVHSIEIMLAAVLTWFVVFSREPYVPLVGLIFGVILWSVRRTAWSKWSLGLFFLLSAIIVQFHGISNIWYSVVSVNAATVAAAELSSSAFMGIGILRIALYPLLVFFSGAWNIFRVLEVSIVVYIFMAGTTLWFVQKHRRMQFIFLGFALALADVRPIVPGSMYYSSFHHILWYGLAIMALQLIVRDLQVSPKTLFLQRGIYLGFFALVVFAWVAPSGYLHEKVDRQTEFTTNYALYYSVGETVRLLSDSTDMLFLEEWDDLIYWQAKRASSYKYSWYTSVMPGFALYRNAREDMFAATPPTFYYGKCSDKDDPFLHLPEGARGMYIRLQQGDKPSCLFVQKNKISEITDIQWESAKRFNYSLPKGL